MPRLSPPVVALALAFPIAVPAASVAQEATPASFLATPDPAECRVEPRPFSFFEEAVRRTIASPQAGVATDYVPGRTVTPTPLAVSEEGSRPADAATVAAVEATVREFTACINAGDLLRVFSLCTEQAT